MGTSAMKAYSVVQSWESGQVGPTTQSVVTEPFSVLSQSWALIWSLEGSKLELGIINARSPGQWGEEEVVSAYRCGQGIAHFNDDGTFQIQICGTGNWVVKVVQVTEIAQYAPAPEMKTTN